MVEQYQTNRDSAKPLNITSLRSFLQHRLKVLFVVAPIESHVTKYVSHVGTLTPSGRVYIEVTKGE